MQLLGPRQEKWLQALESGNYKQGIGFLNRYKKYCCLGILSELFHSEIGLQKLIRSDTTSYGEKISTLHHNLVLYIGLYNDLGSSEDGSEDSLATMNDDGVPFKEIAAKIRSNPAIYFKEPL